MVAVALAVEAVIGEHFALVVRHAASAQLSAGGVVLPQAESPHRRRRVLAMAKSAIRLRTPVTTTSRRCESAGTGAGGRAQTTALARPVQVSNA